MTPNAIISSASSLGIMNLVLEDLSQEECFEKFYTVNTTSHIPFIECPDICTEPVHTPSLFGNMFCLEPLHKPYMVALSGCGCKAICLEPA